jgi:hypothetical protein
MEDLKQQSSLNPSISYGTTRRHFSEHGKERYMFLFLRMYYNMDFVPDFVTIRLSFICFRKLKWHYMRDAVRKWVYIAQS